MEQRSQHERRHHPRFRCEGKAEIRAGNSARVLWGTVTDLSAGGCYIELASPLPLDQVASVTLTFQGVSIAVQAKVAVVHPMFGMGLLFTSCSATNLEKLKRVLAELAGAGAEVSVGSDGRAVAPTQPTAPVAVPTTSPTAAAAAPAHPAGAADTSSPAILRISPEAAYTILDQVIKHLSQKGTLNRGEMLAILKQNQSR